MSDIGPAAILSVLVNADTGQASSRLSKFDAQLQAAQVKARQGIEARLGATLDPVGFERYKVATDRAARVARDRAAFKAELGANYSNRGFVEYERGVDKAIRDSQRLAEASRVPLGRLKTAAGGMSQVGSTLNHNLTLPILGAAAAGVKFGVDFQAAMEQVHTQAGASQAEVMKMSRAILELAPATEQGPVKLAKALYELESVGLRGSRALAALGQASQLAAVGGADLQTATSALASSMVAWQIKTKDAAHTAATLNAIVGAGKMHMQDLVDALGTKLPGTAHMLGISLTSVGAALAAFTDQGVNAETAATNLVTPLFKMAVVTAPKAVTALASIGIGVHTLANDFRTGGINKAIEDLHNHLQGLTKNQQTDVIANAFGGSRGSAPILQLLATYDSATNSIKARQDLILRNTHKWAGDVAAEHATAAHKIKVAWSAIQTALIHIGDSLQPVVTQIAGMLTKIGAFFTGLSPSTRKFVVDVALVVAGLGAFLKIGGAVINTFIALHRVVDKVIGWGKKLIPFFAESGAAADAETVQVNALAAAYERLALAQKGATGLAPIAGGAPIAEAAGAGAAGFGLGLGALPFAALYLAGVGRTSPGGVQGANGRSARGLAALLGPVGASYVRRTALGASSNPAVMARFGDVGATYGTKQINDPNTLRELKALQSGLRGVTNVSQLTTGQLALYYQQIQKLLRQPDLTATQRRGIQTLEGMLVNGLTPAINKALNTQQYSAKAKALIDSFHQTFSWLPTYAHTAGVTASQKLLVAEEELRQIMRTGSRQQREAARGELTKLVTEYKGWMSSIVSHTRGAEAAARGPIHKLAQDWVNTGNTIQRVLVQMADALAKTFGGGFHNAPLTKNAPSWLKSSSGALNIPSTHHAPARHMEWNPFTSTYQLMTSAHHQRLRDLYISEFGKAPSIGPSHAKSSSGPSSTSTSSRTTAAGTQNAFQAPSQSASFQIAMQNIQNALQTAQNSNNVAGQQRLLGREIKLDRKAIGLDDRKLAQIGKQLRGSISKAKRAQLMQDKLTVLQDLGQLRNDIGNAMSQLQSATSASAGTFDLAPAGASVTAPTIYDIRRAARGERHKLAEQHHHHHGDVHIGDIHIHDRKDIDYFADRLDRALGSGVHAKLRAAGMRGT